MVIVKPNKNTLKSVLDIGPNYKVDLPTSNSLRTILGFNSQIYAEGYNESENIVNILSVNSLRVTSDVIGSSFTNGGTQNIIYSFFSKCGSRIQNCTRAIESDISSSHTEYNFSYGN